MKHRELLQIIKKNTISLKEKCIDKTKQTPKETNDLTNDVMPNLTKIREIHTYTIIPFAKKGQNNSDNIQF